MARYRRECPEGSVQHLIQRFINREFRLDDHGRREYLRRLGAVASITDWRWLGYALMSSHLHQLLLAGHAAAAAWLKSLNTGFAQYLNRTQGRLGPVFAERPTTIGCKEEHAARALAYLHNNPVRAGLVDDPADSAWTSHRAYLGEVAAPPWLDVGAGLAACGFDSSPRGRLAFHTFVCERAKDSRDDLLSGDALPRARVDARRTLGPSVEVGYPESTDAGGSMIPIWAPSDLAQRAASDGILDELLVEVAVETSCAVPDFCSRRRDHSAVRARRVLLLAGMRAGLSMKELAAAVGISAASATEMVRSSRCATNAVAELARVVTTRVMARR